MAWLRLFTVLCLMLASCGVGAAGASYRYEQKLLRITEEREVYMALAEQAVAMSDRALGFALGYQEVLNTCMGRLYSSPTTQTVVSNTNPKKGGVGGPLDVRKPSRLP
jgi:CTP:molybdopterin cytidylyltransferase MocA